MAGVSLSQLRDHLKQNIPGLKEHGISKTTVSHLIEHPRQDTISARGYKGFLKTHVPVKQNSYRENHHDQHLSLMLSINEFSEMFNSECEMFTCDNMNKIKVGTLAMSQYHQIQHFYPTEDTSNVPDYDFPVHGYLLIPSEYMRLMLKEDYVADSGENDPEVVLY